MNKYPKVFYKWFVVFALTCATFILAFFEGFFELLLEHDISRLSLVILALFFWCSITIGKTAAKSNTKNRKLKIVRFVNNHFFTLGILGTVIGLIYMTSDVLGGANVQNIIVGLKDGLGTALLTTAAGLIANLLTHLQLFIFKFYEG